MTLTATAMIASSAGAQVVTPVDVFLACRSATVDAKIRHFCDRMQAPRRVRDLTASERNEWATAVPAAADIKAAADQYWQGERSRGTIAAELARIHFGVNSAEPSNKDLVVSLAKQVAANPNLRVTLTGLASATGTERSNANLAAQRAEYVRFVMLENGVRRSQIDDTVVEGDARAVADARGDRRIEADEMRRVNVHLYQSGMQASPDQITTPRSGSLTTNILLGLTDYLIAESIREAQATVLRSRIADLCSNPETQDFISESCAAFHGERNEAYLPSVNRLRSAVRRDLAKLPLELSEAVAPVASTEKACVLVVGAEVFAKVAAGRAPSDAVAQVALSHGCPALLPHVADAITALRDAETAVVELIDNRPLDALTRDSVIQYVVKASAVNVAGGPAAADMVERAGHLLTAVETARAIWLQVVRDIEHARSDSVPERHASRLAALIAAGSPALQAVLSYPGKLDTDVARLLEDVREATTHLATGDYGNAVSALLLAADKAGMATTLPINSLAFAADIAQAGSPADVSAAFGRYARPDRGVHRKRDGAARYLMVNGYAGLSGGWEGNDGERAPVAAFFLPIGVEAGWRLGKPRDAGRWLTSVGILLQIVDLGSLAAVRINQAGGDDLEALPAATIGTVWAPGVTVRLGLGSTRWVAGPGISYVPAARRDSDGNWRDGVRVIVGLGVDVPLYPFAR